MIPLLLIAALIGTVVIVKQQSAPVVSPQYRLATAIWTKTVSLTKVIPNWKWAIFEYDVNDPSHPTLRTSETMNESEVIKDFKDQDLDGKARVLIERYPGKDYGYFKMSRGEIK